MKKWIKLAGELLAAALITAVLLLRLTDLLEIKTSRTKYTQFYNQQENFDVLFFGNSHCLNGIYPVTLWDEYGIAGYNMGGHGSPMPTTYWMLKNSLDYTTPKVVVLECSMVSAPEKQPEKLEYLHQNFDAIPFSLNKARAVLDITDTPQDAMELLWNFSTYHSRWGSVQETDLYPPISTDKGADRRLAWANPEEWKPETAAGTYTESVGCQYLRKAIQLCQQRGITPVLIYLPYPNPNYAEARAAGEIARECGADYINFLEMNLVNRLTDYYDLDSHLNVSGALKVTRWMGEYLSQACRLPDHRGEEAYAHWQTDALANAQTRSLQIGQEAAFEKKLLLLTDPKFSFCLYTDGSEGLVNSQYWPLVENLGFRQEQIPQAPVMLVKDAQTGENRVVPVGQQYQGSMGSLELLEGEYFRLAWNGETLLDLQPGTGQTVVLAWNGWDGQLACKDIYRQFQKVE